MSDSKIYIADINDKNHIELFKEFEHKNDLTGVLEPLKNSNINDIIINQVLFLKKHNEIKDSCFINAEKDKKMCTLSFPDIKEIPRNRTIIDFAENYAFNTLGMEEVFVQTVPTNNNLINNLEKKDYESLGETDGVITFIKDKMLDKEQGRTKYGNR